MLRLLRQNSISLGVLRIPTELTTLLHIDHQLTTHSADKLDLYTHAISSAHELGRLTKMTEYVTHLTRVECLSQPMLMFSGPGETH